MNSNVKADSGTLLVLSTVMLLASVSIASTAFADDQFRTETVNFADLSVTTPAGVQALYSRIHSAAQRVCAATDRLQQARAFACAKKAEVQAIEKLGLPLLTGYYRMKTGDQLSANRSERYRDIKAAFAGSTAR
jgi:UrcA family protein